MPGNNSKSASILTRLWGATPPAVLQALETDVKAEIEGDIKLKEVSSLANILQGNVKKNALTVQKSLLPTFVALALRWYAVQTGEIALDDLDAEVRLSETLFDPVWMTICEGWVNEIECDNEDTRGKHHLSKIVDHISAAYITFVLAVLSSDHAAGTPALPYVGKILRALIRLSIAIDKFIPITEPVFAYVTLAFDNLPAKEEDIHVAAQADCSTIFKASMVDLANPAYHLYIAVSAIDCLVAYIHTLHMHPSFCELSPFLLAQTKRLLKLVETKCMSSKIAERLKLLIAAITASSTQIEAERQNLVMAQTAYRLQVFGPEKRKRWGLEQLRSKMIVVEKTKQLNLSRCKNELNITGFSIVEDNWIDSINALKELTDEDWDRLRLPVKFMNQLRKELSTMQSDTTEIEYIPFGQPITSKEQWADIDLAVACELVGNSCALTPGPDGIKSINILTKVIQNCLNSPNDPKLRKLRLGNPVISNHIVNVLGCQEFLRGVGFIEENDNCLVLKSLYKERLEYALNLLSKEQTKLAAKISPQEALSRGLLKFDPFKPSYVSKAGNAVHMDKANHDEYSPEKLKEAIREELKKRETGGHDRAVPLNPRVALQRTQTKKADWNEDHGTTVSIDPETLARLKDILTGNIKFKSNMAQQLGQLRKVPTYEKSCIRLVAPDKTCVEIDLRNDTTLADLYRIMREQLLNPELFKILDVNSIWLSDPPLVLKVPESKSVTIFHQGLVPNDGSAKIFNMDLIRIVKDRNKPVRSVSHNGSEFLLTVDLDDFKLFYKLNAISPIYSSTWITPSRFAVGHKDGTVSVYSIDPAGSLSLEFQLKVSDQVLCSLSASDDFLSCGSWDGFVYCYSISERSLLWKSNRKMKYGVAVLVTDDSIIAGSQLGHLVKFSRASGDELQSVDSAHEDIIRQVKPIAGCSDRFVTCSNDSLFKIWNAQLEQIGGGISNSSQFFCFDVCGWLNPDGTQSVLTACDDGSLNCTTPQGDISNIWNHDSTLWCLTRSPRGDVVAGTESGQLLVFGNPESTDIPTDMQISDSERNDLRAAALSTLEQQRRQQEAVDMSKLRKASERHLYPGKRAGQTSLFVDNGTVMVYQWTGTEWCLIGEMLGDKPGSSTLKPGSKLYGGDDFFPAGEYDYVFDVEIDNRSGAKLQLPYNMGQNTMEVAERFCGLHNLPKDNASDIVKFINQHTKASSVSAGSRVNQTSNRQESDTLISYDFTVFGSPSKWQIAINKMKELSEASNHPITDELALANIEQSLAKSDFLRVKPRQSEIALLFTVPNDHFYHWPDVTPILDVWRYYVLNLEVVQMIRQSNKNIGMIHFLTDVLKTRLSAPNSILLALRTLANMLSIEGLRETVLTTLAVILQPIASSVPFAQSSQNQAVAAFLKNVLISSRRNRAAQLPSIVELVSRRRVYQTLQVKNVAGPLLNSGENGPKITELKLLLESAQI